MSHDTHTFENGKSLRIIGDGILIQPDKPPDVSKTGLIHFPDGAMEHTLNTGTILAYGKIKPRKRVKALPIPDLEKGLGVVYVRFVDEQHSNQQIRKTFDGAVRIKSTDVLMLYTRDEQERINR